MNDTLKNVEVLPRAAAEEPLYEVREKIYPRAVSGAFARWRLALVLATQLVFYGTPWLEWSGRQAVLFDLGARKFYVFGLVLWPQDFIYLTLLLVISALSLFLFTAVAGRLWCGYACPQTVYTEIFLWIERRIEGDRARRMRRDAAPFTLGKLGVKAAKHASWVVLSLWTGFTFVAYFTPARELALEAAGLSLGPWETFWILFYGFATYGNAGWMREQVCKYMCPYARFQSAMFDSDTLIISYDAQRGEPRGGRSRAAEPRAKGLGDCVDCGICVQVCPTGIDIRKGLQYECIGCAACIDGCNQVMRKMGYAPGLIRYSTENALKNRWGFAQALKRLLRPRVVVYTAILWTLILGTAVAVALRVPLKVDVIRDRGSLSREVEDGAIENVYRLQIMNAGESPRVFHVQASGLPTLKVAGESFFAVEGAGTRMVPVRLRVAGGEARPGSHRIEFEVVAVGEPGVRVRERSVFLVR
ncbi:MAG TPA: cytochrome c oxidase accessory protein CcoG [Burkholderiales bacterium]|nr:cytochrome c oxidase accessory protein CcoG [Burkholderiales bacterium]